MNPVIMFGVLTVNLALVSYAIGVISEQRKHAVTRLVVLSLTIGIVFDITATLLMLLGSSNSPFTIHGLLGYSALIGMALVTWKSWQSHGNVTRKLHLFIRYAFIWWVITYLTGIAMAVARSRQG